MQNSFKQFSIIILFCTLSGFAQQTNSGASDSLFTSLLLSHLRSNFDDIHDVSMRFHHQDHTLGGIISLRMTWENERLDSAEVVQNETGNADFPRELIKKLKTWQVIGLQGPFAITLPLRIKIIGSDDPNFLKKAIFTGKVCDQDSIPLPGAIITFHPIETGLDSVPPARSNREGIFVRTLIPPGAWTIHCKRDGFKSAVQEHVIFQAGEHVRQTFSLNAE